MKYTTYKELADAYQCGEITEPLKMDNDWCGAYVGEEKVFEGWEGKITFGKMKLHVDLSLEREE